MTPFFRSQMSETKELAEWTKGTAAEQAAGVRLILKHPAPVKSLAWHKKGDYFAVRAPRVITMQRAKWWIRACASYAGVHS